MDIFAVGQQLCLSQLMAHGEGKLPLLWQSEIGTTQQLQQPV